MESTEIAKLRSAVRQHVSASREQRFCYRALCVLLIAEGHRPNQVAEWLGEHTRTLERWRKRFVDNGLDGLIDEDVKEDRWQRFMQVASAISAERLAKKVGSAMTVLVDEVDREQGVAVARGPGDAPEID